MSELELLYHDEWLVAVNKPSGMLVHRSALAADADQFVLQQLRNQLGMRVYPLHRLDRPTSGVLLFALNADTAALMGQQFAERCLSKSYLAVVRGWFEGETNLDYPLKVLWDPYGDRGKRPDKPPQAACTRFVGLGRAECEVSFGRYPTSRYSLLRAYPATGRKHQIRRHLKHLSHPIIGDVKYGKGEHNRYFRQRWSVEHLLLHAESLTFRHPLTEEIVRLVAPLRPEFQRVVETLDWLDLLSGEAEYSVRDAG